MHEYDKCVILSDLVHQRCGFLQTPAIQAAGAAMDFGVMVP